MQSPRWTERENGASSLPFSDVQDGVGAQWMNILLPELLLGPPGVTGHVKEIQAT